MHDARDEEDKRLLAAGDHAALVRSYYETIIQRCRVRCRREDDALECAQSVAVRLLSELKRGKRYSVPFRVVVHKVIEWTTKGFYAGGRAILVELRGLFGDGNASTTSRRATTSSARSSSSPRATARSRDCVSSTGTRSRRSRDASGRRGTRSTRRSTAPARSSRSCSDERDIELLFDEFAARHARGEHPDAREFLERAEERRDELAPLLDGFLAAAPVQPPSEETLALFASLVPGPSQRRRSSPSACAEAGGAEIVDWIRERFGIGEEKREKVARYWHELETGLLGERVSERLARRSPSASGRAAGRARLGDAALGPILPTGGPGRA